MRALAEVLSVLASAGTIAFLGVRFYLDHRLGRGRRRMGGESHAEFVARVQRENRELDELAGTNRREKE